MAKQITAIVPAYNEADIISDTVKAILDIPNIDQLIVVDDASTDGTAAAASKAHKVIVLDNNMGKGGTLNAALPFVDGEIVLLLDADLGASAVEAVKLLEPVLNDKADMAVAIFGRSEISSSVNDSSKLAVRSRGFGLVVKFARLGIKILTGKTMEAPLAGPRALKREIIEKCGGFAPKFGVEVGLTIDALRRGYRIVEVPVAMVHRPSGRDVKGFIHRGRQMADVLRILFKKALRI